MSNLRIFTVAYICFAVLLLWTLECVLPSFLTDGYRCISCLLLNAIVIYYCFPLLKKRCFNSRVPPYNKAVLITGCDSGFGKALAERLDSRGFRVFASCLSASGKGANDLKMTCSTRLHVLELDVTNDKSIKEAVTYVKNNLGDSELWALVNNAGVTSGFAVDWSKMESFEKCLDVNTLGPVRVTKAFLPLLKSSRGRVVTVASLLGRLSFLHMTPYTMSKFATVAFSECLRLELKPWNIKVISIEPECYQTQLVKYDNVKKDLEETLQALDESSMADYGEDFFRSWQRYMRFAVRTYSEKYQIVIDSLEDAVSLEHPNNVYQPSRNIIMGIVVQLLQLVPRPVTEAIAQIATHKLLCGIPLPLKAQKLKE